MLIGDIGFTVCFCIGIAPVDSNLVEVVVGVDVFY